MFYFCIMSFMFMFISGVYVFSSKRKHLLLMLLSMEYIILSLYSLLFIYLSMYMLEYYFGLFYLIFCVCESVLGLSLLISLIRTHGNDYFHSMNLLC
uniref:NADH-ubiquinone oxidoreductase chain 4L n=1 Tax=Orectochilus villosus TaxID=107782 RepID=A0A7U3NJQ8_9COLE|nr:NADH dehydrogenase subunit 4L [Orectochilus villosus]